MLFEQATRTLQSPELTLRALSRDVRETAVTVIRVNAAQLQEEKEIRTRPLVRGGIVAGLIAALKTIIIDVPVNHGNSGGPVVQLSRTNKLRIIGIATQYVPVPEDVMSLAPSPPALALGNSGYGVVASADSIIELISTF